MFTELLDLKVNVYCAYDVKRNEKPWDIKISCKPFQWWSNSICGYRDNANNQSDYRIKFNQGRVRLKGERGKKTQEVMAVLTVIKN